MCDAAYHSSLVVVVAKIAKRQITQNRHFVICESLAFDFIEVSTSREARCSWWDTQDSSHSVGALMR